MNEASPRPDRLRALLRLGVGVILSALLLVWLERYPLPASLSAPQWSRALFAADGRLLDVHIAADEQWRLPPPAGPLPDKYVQSVLTFEDRHFAWHPGIDPLAVGRAIVLNLRAGKVRSGASTITMQVARLAEGNAPRTWTQKLRETALALVLEWRFDKNDILALYAGMAPFGGNVVGLHAASWRYFARAPGSLSWAEAALLAVLPNSPALLHPGRHRDRLTHKRDRLLHRLHARGLLDARDLQLALLEPLPAQPEPWPTQAPHLLQRLSRDVKGQALLETTLDADLQRSLQRLLSQQAPTLANEGVRNLATLVIDHDAMTVVAYIGNHTLDAASGRDVDIIDRPRSTGSILKPLLYGMMLQGGELLPSTLVADIPTRFGSYSPENHDLDFRGAVAARDVIAQSLNVPSARMLRRHGVERFRAELQALGFTGISRSAEDYGLSLILGGAEASLWDLTRIYANLTHIAAHPDDTALHLEARLLRARPDHDEHHGEHPDEDRDTPARPFPMRAGAAWLTLQAMTNVVRPGGDVFWRDYENSQVIAWKTGTSFGLRDGWAVGSNGRYTVGVWTGNADGSPAATLGGAHSAGPILMQVFARLGNATWLEKPLTALKTVKVCAADGHLVYEDCPATEQSAPVDAHFQTTSPWHRRIFVSGDGRYRVHGGCERPSGMHTETRFVLPPAMEHFWRRQHSDYRLLPPWRADCIAGLAAHTGERPFDILYPDNESELFIPLEMSGKQGRVVFRAVHRNPDALLHWHLDSQYLGNTRLFHEKAIVADPGAHVLTLTDQDGQRLERRFEVRNPGAR